MSQEKEDGAPEILTIGAYGFSAESFCEALRSAEIDTFCDIRRRRGVRGAEYAWANATRLIQGLEERGIRYHHLVRLAPGAELRQAQAEEDRAAKIAKRQRSALSPGFVEAYRERCLAEFDVREFLAELGPEARRAVLFCVEREPAACHRSLVGEALAEQLGLTVRHLIP